MKEEIKEYKPPEIEVVSASEILEKLGPVMSCSSFSGAVTGC